MSVVNGIAGVQRDWNLYRGDTWQYSFQLKDSAGNILDLSTSTITGVVKLKNDGVSPNEMALNTATNGGISLSNSNKQIDIFKVMAVVKNAVYYYSIKVVFSNGLVVTPVYGTFTFTQNDQ